MRKKKKLRKKGNQKREGSNKNGMVKMSQSIETLVPLRLEEGRIMAPIRDKPAQIALDC